MNQKYSISNSLEIFKTNNSSIIIRFIFFNYQTRFDKIFFKILVPRGTYHHRSVLNKNLKNGGLFPSTFNVAAKADIFVNATCGEEGPETFCKPSESSRCAVCDSRSPDPGKRHNISNVLDPNPGRWWQSPTLARGDHYEYVTILLDLKQVSVIIFLRMLKILKQIQFTEILYNKFCNKQHVGNFDIQRYLTLDV